MQHAAYSIRHTAYSIRRAGDAPGTGAAEAGGAVHAGPGSLLLPEKGGGYIRNAQCLYIHVHIHAHTHTHTHMRIHTHADTLARSSRGRSVLALFL